MSPVEPLFYTALCLAITGWVFVCILTTEDHILRPWRIAVDWFTSLHPYLNWLHKPLVGCELCFSGELALWWYLWFRKGAFQLDRLVMLICVTIFFVYIINSINALFLWIKQKAGLL